MLYAAILAEATNLGLTGMARASRFTYEQLEWTTDWYLRESTLRDANAGLVDYHHALPLTMSWGSGQLSSSDGQRFATRTRGPARCRATSGTAAAGSRCTPGPLTNTANTTAG